MGQKPGEPAACGSPGLGAGFLVDHVAPVVGEVAALALGTLGVEMDVVLPMAALAFDGKCNFVDDRIGMTGKALDFDVLLDELEAGPQIVVEPCVFPAVLVVAQFAARTQALPVYIVRRMTGGAICLRVLERRARVALLAIEPGVTIPQREC